MSRRPLFALWLLGAAGLVVACSDAAAPVDDGAIGSIVEPGKSDNFFSKTAREYWVEGTVRVKLDASWAAKTEAERVAEVKRLIPFKQIMVGWFLNAYIVDKEEHDGNASYGGFRALTKNGSYEDLNLVKVDETTWTFDFRQEIGGQLDLISAIPDAKAQTDGSWTFDLTIGTPSNDEIVRLETNDEWYRSAPWDGFNPANVSASQKEILPLKIRPESEEQDAWIDTERLFADGKLSIGIHFGWDYHSSYHLKHSKEIYTWLTKDKGFKSPVASYDKLRFDSGPLKGTVTYHGKTIAVEIALFWGIPGDAATDPDTGAGGIQLEKSMYESFRSRKVIIFSGHSGPFYGFALANWKKTDEGDLDDSDVLTMDLWKGQYQIVVAEGCDTYGLGEAFALNPQKPGLLDIDVLTTTSFSNASTAASVKNVLAVLIGASGKKEVATTKYSQLLVTLDGGTYGFSTMYGVHGIDDNPRVHPWAKLANACKSCKKNAECGDGMRCVAMLDGKTACAAECVATIACGTGYECRNVGASSYLQAKVCAPQGLSCTATQRIKPVVINEIVAAPTVDHSGDGALDKAGDEYVELVNPNATSLDLTGWTLADGTGTRHRFATGTVIPPGGALIVFGKGAALVAGTTIAQSASTGTLALNNTGDTVQIGDLDGHIVAKTTYGTAINNAKAWQRQKDGDDTSAFAAATPTPGKKTDGSNF